MAEVNGMRRRLIEYLERYGLEARNISADDWTEEGYYSRVPLTGEVSYERFPWPEGFDYAWFSTLVMVADREDYRLAGLRPQVVH